jgi:hypothetical protein
MIRLPVRPAAPVPFWSCRRCRAGVPAQRFGRGLTPGWPITSGTGLVSSCCWPSACDCVAAAAVYNISFRFDSADLLTQYVTGDNPQTMSTMRRALALRIKDDWRRDGGMSADSF